MECYYHSKCILLTGHYDPKCEVPLDVCRNCNNEAKDFELEFEMNIAEKKEFKDLVFWTILLFLFGIAISL